MQDSLSPEKHINRIFGDTFKILRNTQTAFHFLEKDIVVPGAFLVCLLFVVVSLLKHQCGAQDVSRLLILSRLTAKTPVECPCFYSTFGGTITRVIWQFSFIYFTFI